MTITTREIEQEKNENILFLSLTISILLSVCVSIFISINYTREKIAMIDKNDTYNTCTQLNITEILDKASQGCGGSTSLSKWSWQNDNQWSYFHQKCNSDGYCKQLYTPLEDCLKEVEK